MDSVDVCCLHCLYRCAVGLVHLLAELLAVSTLCDLCDEQPGET